MDKISACEVTGLNKGAAANGGEFVFFGLSMPKEGDVNFAIPYALLWPLINNLLQLGNEASALRDKNPIHQGTPQFGFIFSLDSMAISPNLKQPGWHVLELQVRGSHGTGKYLVGADRERLEALISQIREYLDRPNPTQGQPVAH